MEKELENLIIKKVIRDIQIALLNKGIEGKKIDLDVINNILARIEDNLD